MEFTKEQLESRLENDNERFLLDYWDMVERTVLDDLRVWLIQHPLAGHEEIEEHIKTKRKKLNI